jgi:hypothetical protein
MTAPDGRGSIKLLATGTADLEPRPSEAVAISQIVWSGWGRQLWRQAGFSAGAPRLSKRPPQRAAAARIGGPTVGHKNQEIGLAHRFSKNFFFGTPAIRIMLASVPAGRASDPCIGTGMEGTPSMTDVMAADDPRPQSQTRLFSSDSLAFDKGIFIPLSCIDSM